MLILLSFIMKAQQNDTAFLRFNKVATVHKYQFVHAFEGNEDTCLLELKKFNKNSDIIFHRTDMGCIGWNNTEERFFTYYNDQLQTLEIRRDNLPYAKSLFEYDDLNDPVIGTAVTRALLKLSPDSIGETVEERARQWKDFWNTKEGAGTVQKYIDDVSAMK